jgi:hypothetical protein
MGHQQAVSMMVGKASDGVIIVVVVVVAVIATVIIVINIGVIAVVVTFWILFNFEKSLYKT